MNKRVSTMKHKWFYPTLILVMMGTATLITIFRMDREKAIRQAIVACDEIYGLQLQEAPVATQTRLTTYGRTISPRQNRDLWWPTDAGSLVWVIEMEGIWMSFPTHGGPLPTDGDVNPEPALVDDGCTIVIAAFTGETKTQPIE